MKISYKHIIKHFSSNPSIEEVSEKLFQLGHENEIEKNSILNIEFTPNKGDCLSVMGIVRELSIFFEIKEKKDIYKESINLFDFNFKNMSTFDCPKITFLKIEIEDIITEYKSDLKSYFEDLDIKKNNFFTDISNYISYETGQPTHCYDAKKIKSELCLKKIKNDKTFKTLTGKEITLIDENLVFSINDEVVNLAGVMGGESTSCSKSTKEVIIECAFFKPDSIVGKSIKYDLQSDAAYKFERGVDPLCHEDILRRLIYIVKEHSKIKSLKIFSESYEDIKEQRINFNIKAINKIIGVDINEKEYSRMLLKLGFDIKDNYIIIPSYRSDISSQNDLAEEVARIIGYDQIPLQKLSIPSTKKPVPYNNKEQCIKNLLIDNGFYEVINNPFTSLYKENSMKVDNPLDSSKQYLRFNLKNSLIENLLYNEKRQNDSIKLFELSDVYLNKGEIEKTRLLGIIASGRVSKNYKDFSRKVDKEYFLSFINQLGIKESNSIMSISREDLDSKSKNKILYFEINIDNIPDTINDYDPISSPPSEYRIYDPISEFPSSKRDLSFSISNLSMLNNLKKTIENHKHDDLKEVFIFDFYENIQKKEIKIGFRFIFQSKTKTLRENEINLIMKDIIDKSLDIDSVTIPGLKK